MKLPRISVIVPSYQQGRFLADCLGSIVNQNYRDVEVLVFDAGSTDETSEVLKQFSQRLDLVCVEKDLGQAHAINKGLARAEGEILCYLNSDDVLCSNSLSRVGSFFEEHPCIDLLYGKAQYIDEKGDVIGDYLTREWNESYFSKECFICQPAAFWRRSVFERIGNFEQGLKYSIDYDYWLRVAGAGMNVAYLEEYLACSRDYPQTKTRSGHHRIFWENFRILTRRMGYVPGHWFSGYLHRILLVDPKPLSVLVPKSQKMRDFFARVLEVFSRLFARDIHMFTEKKYNNVI